MVPKVTLADDSKRIPLYDVLFRYAVGATESDGTLSMLEVTVPARTLIKPHMHTREDEFTLVLEGNVSARLGDEIVETIPAGSWLVKPRSIPHAMWNVTAAPARILEVVMPGGLESLRADRPGPHGARSRLDEALRRARRGIRIDDPERLDR